MNHPMSSGNFLRTVVDTVFPFVKLDILSLFHEFKHGELASLADPGGLDRMVSESLPSVSRMINDESEPSMRVVNTLLFMRAADSVYSASVTLFILFFGAMCLIAVTALVILLVPACLSAYEVIAGVQLTTPWRLQPPFDVWSRVACLWFYGCMVVHVVSLTILSAKMLWRTATNSRLTDFTRPMNVDQMKSVIEGDIDVTKLLGAVYEETMERNFRVRFVWVYGVGVVQVLICWFAVNAIS